MAARKRCQQASVDVAKYPRRSSLFVSATLGCEPAMLVDRQFVCTRPLVGARDLEGAPALYGGAAGARHCTVGVSWSLFPIAMPFQL